MFLLTGSTQAASLEFDFELRISDVGDTLATCLPDECIAPTFTPLSDGDMFTGSGITADTNALSGIGKEYLELESFTFSYIDFFTGAPYTYTEASFATGLGDYIPVGIFQNGTFLGVEGAGSRGAVGEVTRIGYAAFYGDIFEGYATISEFMPGLFVYDLDYIADGTITYFTAEAVPEPSTAFGLVTLLGIGFAIRRKRTLN